MYWKGVLFAFLIAVVACGCAQAKNVAASLQGPVTGSSDAAVPGATVDQKKVAAGAGRTTITSEGIFNCVMSGHKNLAKSHRKAGSL